MRRRPFEIDRELTKRFLRPGMSESEMQQALTSIQNARTEAYARYDITNEDVHADVERIAAGDTCPNGPNAMWKSVWRSPEGDGSFQASLSRLKRAGEHLDALMSEEHRLRSIWVGSTVTTHDENGNAQVSIIGGDKPDMSRLSLLLGDYIHNLRAALDLALSELCRLFGGDDHRVSFPHGENEQDLRVQIENCLRQRKASDPRRPGYDDIASVLLILAAHDDENFLLRAVAIFDNQNKHRQMIVSSAQVSGVSYEFGLPQAEAEKERPLHIQFNFPLESYLDGFPLVETCRNMATSVSEAVTHLKASVVHTA